MTDLRDTLASTHSATIYRGARKVGGEPMAWESLSKHDQLSVYALMDPLLPVIAAHEAEVAGRILDRIDALHAKSTTRVYTERECQDGICDDHHDPISGAIYCPSYLLDVCRECSHYCCDDGDRDEPYPCPTRRLTAEIRGELSHG